MNLRSFLYTFARLLGDLSAVRRGPKAIVKRLGNKVIGRKIYPRLRIR